ncbi:NADH dehydrogenase subunit 3 (mitochondrion) [Saccoglossus kowalevskii]|uniref:NADH-ubiquinone oxidoreductase chain 3 n=1 Tax=Saccoglossus kowalevskii TaxID=10224 RepID=Q3L8T5_SACKO|nr:NADH dehydrogenase subunit 3 [Saccoglossus kowalevskii]AAQ92983.1 NADH dehydrogenase subunit 3 [Saccoglossus kowalevskii]
MTPLIIFFLFSLILCIILSIVGHRLPTRSLNLEKLSPYECGFEPHTSARLPFSLRFFLIAILFLLFDLEIALLLPLPSALASLNPTLSFLLAFIVLAILTLGLIYEWVQGGLEWAE